MQLGKIGKIVAAGTLAGVMIGSSIGFAALDAYPAPFVTGGVPNTLIVIGSGAGSTPEGIASDVVGAINIAARLGGESTTSTTVAGTVSAGTITGEGKNVATANKKIFLNDTLGKTGLRNTMTKDDLPVLLADGTLVDSDAGTSHKYTQYIKVTPGTANLNNYRLQFEKPGDSSMSNEDPTYSFGEFTQSPDEDEWFYQTQVIFDKEVNGTTAVGEKVKLFGGEYTVNSDTTFTAGGTSNKFVLAGGADTRVMKAAESVSLTIGTTTYDVTLVGASSSTQAVVKVGNDQKTLTKGAQTQVGGLDVYIDDVFYLSSTDPTQNSAKLLLGSNKIVLQHGGKVKVGTDETAVQGTFVNLTVSGGKLSTMTVYVAGKSSSADFLKLGGSYSDPVWKTFNMAFPSLSESTTADSRGIVKIEPSGDNLATITFTDDRGQTKTVNWAYKSASSGTTFLLGDSGGDRIEVQEGAAVTQNEYFLVDQGDFTHMYELTSITADGSTSASLDITDVFSGTTTKVDLGSDNQATKVIDGQTYYFDAATTANTVYVYGGTSATNVMRGTYATVFPKIKTNKGAYVVLYNQSAVTLSNGLILQLPTGAITTTLYSTDLANFTIATNEDGTTGVGTSLATGFNLTALASDVFTLGKTANGGLVYNITGIDATHATLKIVGGSGTAGLTSPAVVLVEEEDDAKDQYTITTTLGTEASGSNYQASINSVSFSDGLASEVALGSDSNNYYAVDRYGTFEKHWTSSQDKVWLYYPDLQVTANVAVLATGASFSEGTTTSGSTVKTPNPIKTPLAKLDKEVVDADKTTKNLILVGGPVVNTLVKDLATSNKAWDVNRWMTEGQGTAVLQLVSDAFATGKSALVVAGFSAADTRTVANVLQQYDSHTSELTGKSLAVWKNGVISSTTA
jgi:hypothetical protein